MVDRRDGRLGKFARSLRVGYDQQRRGYVAFLPVGRAVRERQLARARVLCEIGRRAAAVEVDGVYTAELEHLFRQFLVSIAAGIRGLPSVSNHEDDVSVCRNADRRARLFGGIIGIRRGRNHLAVLNEAQRAADRFDRVFGQRARADVRLAVGSYGEPGLRERGCVRFDLFAVHDENAGRLARTHVKEVRVDRRNDVDAAHTFCRRRLFGDGRHRPLSARIVVGIAGNHSVARHIDLNGIRHDLVVVRAVLRIELRFLYAGRNALYRRRNIVPNGFRRRPRALLEHERKGKRDQCRNRKERKHHDG